LKSAHHQGPRPLPPTPDQHPLTHTQLGRARKGLRQIIDSSINYKLKHGGTIRISWKEQAFDGSRLHRNATYNEVLDAIESIILFRLSNYFLRFSNDFKRKTGLEQFPNDW